MMRKMQSCWPPLTMEYAAAYLSFSMKKQASGYAAQHHMKNLSNGQWDSKFTICHLARNLQVHHFYGDRYGDRRE